MSMRPAAPGPLDTTLDAYPSRTGDRACLRERLEPVVFAPGDASPPIAQELVERYQRDGFIVLDDIFTRDEIRLMQTELDELQQQPQRDDEASIYEPADHCLRSVFAIHQSNVLFERIAQDSRLVDIARYLLDDDVYVYQSRLNYKPGFRGKEFYWHSDFETWHVEDGMPRMRALSISILLTENRHSNGALMLIPGSHHHFVSCEGHTPKNHFKQSLRKQEYGIPEDALLEDLVNAGGIELVDAQPGSVVIFDCNTMHGSNSNITPWPRSNAFIVYNAMSNRVVAPYCDRPPRPEYICTRKDIHPVEPRQGGLYVA